MVTTADEILSAPVDATVIEAEGVGFGYGVGDARTEALADLRCRIGRGEVVIMTGPSGSGKTTFLSLIGGLRRMQDGRLTVLGHDLSRPGHRRLLELRRSVGFIFQHHNLFQSLTALENVRMAATLQAGSRRELVRRSQEVLERLGLGERLHHRPGALSGGQRQRVAIARALVNQPSLILADEPTAALDAKSASVVLDLFRELADGPDRATILIVTHDDRLSERTDRIISMVGGRIVSNVLAGSSVRICRALQRCPDLEPLHPDEATLATLAERMTVLHVRRGEVLVHEDTPGTAFYLIASGSAEASDDGVVRRRLGVDDGFGELTHLSGRPNDATVRAVTDLELYVLAEKDCLEALQRTEGLEERLRAFYLHRQG